MRKILLAVWMAIPWSLLIVLAAHCAEASFPEDINNIHHMGCRIIQFQEEGQPSRWHTRVYAIYMDRKWEKLYSIRDSRRACYKDCDSWMKSVQREVKRQCQPKCSTARSAALLPSTK